MAKLLLDFTNIEDWGGDFEPIPAGVYDAVIDATRSEVRQSQAGNTVLNVAFVIQNHPEYTGRIVFENYAITDKALWKIGQMLEALGFDVKGKKFTFDHGELHNKRCRIHVIQEEYNGTLRNRVKRVAPPSENGAAKVSTGGFPF